MPFRKLNVLIEEKQTLDSLLVSGHPRKLLSVVLLRGWVVTSCSWTKYEVAYECHVCYSRCIHFCKELLLGSTLDSDIMSTDFFFFVSAWGFAETDLAHQISGESLVSCQQLRSLKGAGRNSTIIALF